MKRRAKIEKKSMRERVADYDEVTANQGKNVHLVAADLNLTVQQVYSCRTANKKMARKATSTGVEGSPLLEKDIITISKIGVESTERILRLLKQL
jgi:hypothetical protein